MVKFFVDQEEVDFPPGTRFEMGPEGETRIVLPPYICIVGPRPGTEIRLEEGESLILQAGAILQNVAVIEGP